MKISRIALAATLFAPLMLVGCIGQQTIYSQALAPTEAEAKQQAKAQLDDLAHGRTPATSTHYKTKLLSQPTGDIYQVTASERVKN